MGYSNLELQVSDLGVGTVDGRTLAPLNIPNVLQLSGYRYLVSRVKQYLLHPPYEMEQRVLGFRFRVRVH